MPAAPVSLSDFASRADVVRPLAAALLAAALTAPTQVPPPSGPAPSTPSPLPASPPVSPRIVHLDVFAADSRGRFVSGLTPADFELREDGVVQSIDAVRLVRDEGPGPEADGPPPAVRSARDEREAAGRPGVRAIGILLDEYHLTPEAAARARSLLELFVQHEVAPRDLLAVVKPLDSLFDIRATRDRTAVGEALASLQGRLGDYAPRNAFERNYIAGEPTRVDAARAQVTLSALRALVTHLGGLSDGRKTVLFVSQGLTPPGPRRGAGPMAGPDGILRAANRFNVAIYAFDPAADGDEVPPLLGRLADGTDGAAFGSGPEAPRRFLRMASDAGEYYLITYRSRQPTDGRFRAIDVRVGRPGVRVRSRKGYWALFPDEALALKIAEEGAIPKPKLPPELAEPWHASPLIRPWFGTARGADGRTRVTFVWEPTPRVPGDRSRRPDPAIVVLKALSATGSVVFDGPVRPVDPGDVLAPPDARPASAVFDAPPGRLRLRMSIQDAAAQPLDRDVRDIAVRSVDAEVVLGTPEVFRARTALELRALTADAAAVPVASRDFSRTETLVIRVPAYAARGVPHVSARLMTRFGNAIRPLPVAPAEGGRPSELTLPLASFAPGEYVVEITASAQGGVARDLVNFRVSGS
jgi:VWFA-related protein